MYEYSFSEKTEEDKTVVSPYCELHEGTVASFKRSIYFTISPNPRDYEGYEKGHTLWMAKIRHIMFNTCCDYIYVLELAGLRPHYHGVADVKDLVGFNKRMYNASRFDNVKVHNKFKDGLNYIFKSVDDTEERTGISPIRTRLDDVSYKKQKQIEKNEAKKKLSIEPINDYPDWMLN